MPQKLMAQASTLGSAFDQTGQVRHHKTLLRPHAHHTQVGVQGGEGIVGNAGARIGDGRYQSGFARIGHAQQAHIGQHLEFQLEAFALTGPARGFLARCTVDGAFKAHIAKATISALGDHDLLARLQQLIQHFARFGVANQGAHRHLEHDVVGRRAKHVRTHAVLATFGLVAA